MRLAVSLVMVATFVGLVASVAEEVAAAAGDRLSISRTNVNIRSGPDINSSIVTTINPGEALVEIDVRNDWYLVNLLDRNQKGWIYGPLLDESQPAKVANGSSAPFAPRTMTSTPAVPSSQSQAPEAKAAIEQDLASVTNDLPFLENGRNRLSGDPVEGEKVFYKCGACHTTAPGINAEGPSLAGVVGNRPGRASGFGYSAGMRAFAADGAVWDEATLDEFIRRPARKVRGTSMPFSGVRDPKQRRDLIAFLSQLGPRDGQR